MKPKFKEIVLSTFKPGQSTDPYSIYFVYQKNQEPLVIKGRSAECKTYIEQRCPYSVYRYTFWFQKTSRGGWKSTKTLGIYFIQKDRKYEVSIVKNGKVIYMAKFRSIPKRWIDVYDLAL